jgi:hypothetical protein
MALAFIVVPPTMLYNCLRSHGLSEVDRVEEYRARGHSWPPRPSEYAPPDPGWSALLHGRFDQLSRIADLNAKYNGYMSVVHAALLAPNFTEYGWGLTRAPTGLVNALAESLRRGLESGDAPVEMTMSFASEEHPLHKPLMIRDDDLNTRAMHELRGIHEAWSGTGLIPNNAYGLRVYRNQSKLLMHVDETRTHVISSILHVGHDPDGMPWPLVIEDLHGNTNEVYLETGDLLLYESSKCFHGRPRRYDGKWYSSLFTHYYPVDWDGDGIVMDAHYRVPPEWMDVPEEGEGGPTGLVVKETSFNEPDCEHGWCNLAETIEWKRPDDLEFGQVLSGDGKVRSLGLDSRMEGEGEL